MLILLISVVFIAFQDDLLVYHFYKFVQQWSMKLISGFEMVIKMFRTLPITSAMIKLMYLTIRVFNY